MKTVQVYTCGREFIGQTDDPLTSDRVLLTNTVAVFQIAIPGGINQKMIPLVKDTDYLCGDLWISLGPGVLCFPLAEGGRTHNQYTETISNIIQLDKKIVGATH